ncbi:hypothetical protein C9J85_18680 [Haloferax sp. wsp5]|nr:hypothetical protein C9J85_18680 [Haloferax sp. wsp5]
MLVGLLNSITNIGPAGSVEPWMEATATEIGWESWLTKALLSKSTTPARSPSTSAPTNSFEARAELRGSFFH